jgi:hypothetical protein
LKVDMKFARTRSAGMIGVVALMTLALALTACGDDPDVPPLPSPTEAREVTTPPAEQPPGTSPASFTPPDTVRVAIEQAARDAGVEPDAVELIKFEAHDFPDASLGCPKPGMAYAQVVTPGYVVHLRVNGQDHDYRVSMRSRVVQCF